ncbi:MAG: hypothetical protein JRD89_21350, partial [Deltaproteobacteria bacterium]|nr:hypothetical protein [Deltaproteobacteria bacterium]
LFSLLFVAVSFARYYPIAATNPGVNLFPLSDPKGVDASYYMLDLPEALRVAGGWGHVLTLCVSNLVCLLAPDEIDGVALLGFFSLAFAWSAYYFVRPRFRRPWLQAPVAYLRPSPVLALHSQDRHGGDIRTALFHLALPSSTRPVFERQEIVGAFDAYPRISCTLLDRSDTNYQIPVFLAHFWTGAILTTSFIVYILAFDRRALVRNWKFGLSLIALICFFLRFESWHRLIEIALWYYWQGGSPLTDISLNHSNLENAGILLLGGIGVLGLERRAYERMLGAWFLTLALTMLAFWSSVATRVWMMMPFLFLSLPGAEYLLERGHRRLVPAVVAIMLWSGWFIA